MATAELLYPRDHPTAQAHFPGNPIIPGAVLLCDALRAIESGTGAGPHVGLIRMAKFHAPARPGDRVLVEFAAPSAGRWRFSCSVDGVAVLSGEAACDATTTTG